MMYTILFEKGLDKEAKIVKNILKKVYGLACVMKEDDLSGVVRHDKKLGGNVVRRTKMFKDHIALTKKELFAYGAKPNDWIFGYATKQKNFIISVKRLKAEPRLYKERLESIVIHELGHALVKRTKHYKVFVCKDKKTGQKMMLGMHCPDKSCVMAQTVDLKELDKQLRIIYKGHFCKKCRPA